MASFSLKCNYHLQGYLWSSRHNTVMFENVIYNKWKKNTMILTSACCILTSDISTGWQSWKSSSSFIFSSWINNAATFPAVVSHHHSIYLDVLYDTVVSNPMESSLPHNFTFSSVRSVRDTRLKGGLPYDQDNGFDPFWHIQRFYIQEVKTFIYIYI